MRESCCSSASASPSIGLTLNFQGVHLSSAYGATAK